MKILYSLVLGITVIGGGRAQPLPIFEVADLRIHDSKDTTSMGLMVQQVDRSYGLLLLRQTMRHGNVMLRDVPLRMLIELAWNAPEDLLSAPTWMNDIRYDVVARADSPNTSEDELCHMLQGLLQSRLNLQMHIERRVISVHVLTPLTGSSKLERADPPGSTEEGHCTATRKLKYPLGMVCLHESMSAFARDLPGLASKYADRPIIDETGLSGEWSFTLGWTPVAAIEEEGGMPLQGALRTQLGLKLQPARRSMPIWIVDHCDPSPHDR
jgi:uncharacterized protein (TIGR03435 family)